MDENDKDKLARYDIADDIARFNRGYIDAKALMKTLRKNKKETPDIQLEVRLAMRGIPLEEF